MSSKRRVSEVIFALLLIGMLTSAFNIHPAKATRTIYIRSDGSVDPPTAPIQRDGDVYFLTGNITSDTDGIVIERDDITLNGAGYTVQGNEALYSKGITLSKGMNVTIKNVEIKGFHFGIWLKYSSNNNIHKNKITSNRKGIFIDGSSNYNSIFGNTITNNSVSGIDFFRASDNAIWGNNITRDNGEGVWFLACSNNNVVRNNITSNKSNGISLLKSESNNVSENNIKSNYNGISLKGSSDNSISENNVASNGYYGIKLSYSPNNTLRSNVMTDNRFNFFVERSSSSDSRFSDFINDVDTSNIADGKPVYYWVNEHDKAVPIDAGYVALVNCTRITVQNLHLTENGEGIVLAATTNSIITANKITNSYYGIYIYKSSNNSICENTVTNSRVCAIYLDESSGNKVYHNDFKMTRVFLAHIRGVGYDNSWDDGYPSGGNYWSDYKERYPDAKELDDSGIWDTPYVIDENNQDNYPLMNPWSTPQEVTVTGHFYYLDSENNNQPVDRALVELYDEELGSDDLLDSTYTTSEGYFVLGPVENVDDELGESGTRDLYIKVYAENWAGRVGSTWDPDLDDLGPSYEFRTATEWDMPDGEHDWGNILVPEEQYPVFFILHTITLGYDYAHSFVESLPSVNVLWYQGYEGYLSQGTGYHPPTDTIHLSGTENNPDQWDDGIILHEYGHFVGDKLDIFSDLFPPGEAHEWNGTYSPELAWSEGWAHFFSCAARGSSTYRNTYAYDIWTEYNVETGIESNDLGEEKDGNALGASCEASVAGILWDIYDGYSMRDDQNSDDVGDNLDDKEDAIWDVVLSYSTRGLLPHKVYTIFDFWDGWFARGHGHRQEMWDIYYEHGETMPLEEHTQTFNITLGEETFNISIVSNSTITGFNFSQTLKQVSFNVTGPIGTTGFCNVTIPNDLLWGEFTVYMDGSLLVKDVDYTQIHNGTHYIFYITYIHSTHIIEIRGSEVIQPDTTPFPTWMVGAIVAVIAIAVTATLLLRKRK